MSSPSISTSGVPGQVIARSPALEGGATARRRGRRHSHEFRLLFWASFVVFLLTGLVARLLPGRTLGRGVAGGKRQSLLAEARSAAGATVPFAFMG